MGTFISNPLCKHISSIFHPSTLNHVRYLHLAKENYFRAHRWTHIIRLWRCADYDELRSLFGSTYIAQPVYDDELPIRGYLQQASCGWKGVLGWFLSILLDCPERRDGHM
jgi:hypothetical protein